MQAWEKKRDIRCKRKTITSIALSAVPAGGLYMTYKLIELPSLYDLLARIEKLEKELANVSTK